MKVAREHLRCGTPMIVLETALPIKFAATIEEARSRARSSGQVRRHRSPAQARGGDAVRRADGQGLHCGALPVICGDNGTGACLLACAGLLFYGAGEGRMKAIGFAGYSGAGKTYHARTDHPRCASAAQCFGGQACAHHDVDVDVPGKDSWRHRKAGAFEVLLVTEMYGADARIGRAARRSSVHEMLAELDPSVDWVIVEGFKQSELPKIEIWREPAAGDKPRAAALSGRCGHFGDCHHL